MLFNPKSGHGGRYNRLTEQLRHAATPSRELFADITEQTCIRLPAMRKAGKTALLDRLVDAGAWTDAALALLALELPAWTLRRLVYEDDNWHCALSRQPHLPLSLDDTVDANHEDMALAVLSALVDARQHGADAKASSPSVVPHTDLQAGYRLDCENFS